MKINKKNGSYKSSEKKIINNFSFFTVLLRQAFYLPILLIFGVEILRFITYFNYQFINRVTIGFFLFLIVFITFTDFTSYFFIWWVSLLILFSCYERYVFKKKIEFQKLDCFFCKKKAITKLIKIFLGMPIFFIIFRIPICEQHLELLVEDPKKILIEGQKINKRYRSIIQWLNILIIVYGIVSIYSIGLLYGPNGKIIIIILVFVLFTIQLIFYIYLCKKMYIETKKNLSKTNE